MATPVEGPKSRGNPSGLRVKNPGAGGHEPPFRTAEANDWGNRGSKPSGEVALLSTAPEDSFWELLKGWGGEDRAASWPPVARRASQICLRHRPEVLRHKRRQPPPLIPARRTNRRTCCDAARTQGARTNHQAIRATNQGNSLKKAGLQAMRPDTRSRGSLGFWKPNNCGGRTGRLLEGGEEVVTPPPLWGGWGGTEQHRRGGPREGCQAVPPLWGRRNVG